ncbi:MAG: SufD family Fe-S cluster assembly protein [Giesbergeria sp.]
MNIRPIAAHEAMLMAREHLAATGWVAARNESFRHLPPPPAALWLTQDANTQAESKSGWSISALDGGTPSGIVQRTLDATQTAQRAELYSDLAVPGDDDAAPFAWAHRALCTTGLRLQVQAGTAQQPTHLELRHQPTTQVEAPLLVLDIAEGAHCVLRELHLAGDAATPGGKVQNLQLHIRLGRGASLQHLRVVAPHADDRCAHIVHAQVGEDAHYVQAFVAGGSSYHLQRSQVLLNGAGACAHVAGLTCAAETQFEQQVFMHHAAARTTSHSEALVLASGKAHTVANAKTYIAAGSDEADVHQHLAGIPLGGQPRLVLRPHLEIYHDNVQAAHGATWGALPEDALFYARQRGLDETAARSLIIEGMANALLSRAFPNTATLDALTQGNALQGVLHQVLEATHG